VSRLRNRRPSPALVVATLAIFVALGGTVWAAARIDGRTIKPKSLPGNRVIVGSLPVNRLGAGLIAGNHIAAGTLGQVPSAVHADTADSARAAASAIHAQAADDAGTVDGYPAGCQAEDGLRYFAGACWETQAGATAMNANEAAVSCGRRGGELPRALALKAFSELDGVVIDLAGEWSGEIGGTSTEDVYTMAVVAHSGAISFVDHKQALPFRCVLPLVH
jgi:hypothetical protein